MTILLLTVFSTIIYFSAIILAFILNKLNYKAFFSFSKNTCYALFIFLFVLFFLQKVCYISFIGTKTNDIIYLICLSILDIEIFIFHRKIYKFYNKIYILFRSLSVIAFVFFLLLAIVFPLNNVFLVDKFTPELYINSSVNVSICNYRLYAYKKFFLLKRLVQIIDIDNDDLTYLIGDNYFNTTYDFTSFYRNENNIYVASNISYWQTNPDKLLTDGLIFVNNSVSVTIIERTRHIVNNGVPVADRVFIIK